MSTLYIYDNKLLGDDGADFENALTVIIEGSTEAECLETFAEVCNPNDYTASFTGPA